MKKSTISFEAVIVAFVMLTMLILVFLGVLSTMGGALASKENGHYTLDLITGMMKPKMKRVFLIIDTLLTCAAASVLLYTGIIMVKSQMKIGSLSIALKIPNWVYGSFVPIGLAFILYRSIQFIVQLQKKSDEK